MHLVVDLCRELIGLPRHLGIHNGGLILTGNPLATRIPVEPPVPEGSPPQMGQESLETAGINPDRRVRLRMLSAIDEAERMIQRGRDRDREKFSAFRLPTSHFRTTTVYAMISPPTPSACFRSSRAQRGAAAHPAKLL